MVIDQNIVKNAPSILQFLGSESLEHFEKVKELLTIAEIPFAVEFHVAVDKPFAVDVAESPLSNAQ